MLQPPNAVQKIIKGKRGGDNRRPNIFKMQNNILISIAAWQVALIVVAVVVVLIVALLFGTAIMFHNIIFSRQDKVEEYKYFTAKDFNLFSEDIKVTYRRTQLYAKIYATKPVEECPAVVIFQHGFGAGSSSYMTEIAFFARQGYAVVAADAYGCNNSAGKSSLGFYAGAEAVIAAYIGVNRDKRINGKKVFLVGHSWGAYSVLAASSKIKVDGVVALSAFNKPATCICDQFKNYRSASAKFMAVCLKPFFYLVNILRFGFSGNANAAKCVEKSGVKALLLHGEKDKVVPIKHGAISCCGTQNVQKLVLPEKGHNPYNSVSAEDKLRELMSPPKFADLAEEHAFYSSFDWVKATEEDEKVMNIIDNFLKSL